MVVAVIVVEDDADGGVGQDGLGLVGQADPVEAEHDVVGQDCPESSGKLSVAGQASQLGAEFAVGVGPLGEGCQSPSE